MSNKSHRSSEVQGEVERKDRIHFERVDDQWLTTVSLALADPDRRGVRTAALEGAAQFERNRQIAAEDPQNLLKDADILRITAAQRTGTGWLLEAMYDHMDSQRFPARAGRAQNALVERVKRALVSSGKRSEEEIENALLTLEREFGRLKKLPKLEDAELAYPAGPIVYCD